MFNLNLKNKPEKDPPSFCLWLLQKCVPGQDAWVSAVGGRLDGDRWGGHVWGREAGAASEHGQELLAAEQLHPGSAHPEGDFFCECGSRGHLSPGPCFDPEITCTVNVKKNDLLVLKSLHYSSDLIIIGSHWCVICEFVVIFWIMYKVKISLYTWIPALLCSHLVVVLWLLFFSHGESYLCFLQNIISQVIIRHSEL